MRHLRLIGAFGTLIVGAASLSEYGCATSSDIKPPPASTTAASGGHGYGGATQGGTTSTDTNTGGTSPTGGAIATGGMTSCSDDTLTLCNNACVDTGTDHNNCGDCNITCGTTEVCAKGLCGCPMSNADGDAGPITNYQSCVAGQCVDLQSSNTNCGSCYNVCTPKRCIEGACGCAATDISCNKDVACGPTEANCGCFDPLTDENHCGDCPTKCGQYQECAEGQCVLNCALSNLTDCNGTCVDLQNDPADKKFPADAAKDYRALNCGACGQECPTDKFLCSNGECACKNPIGSRCGDKCVDLQTNVSFCGSCTNFCEAAHDCVGGQCVCSATSTQCGTGCYDITSDSSHCGNCETVCGVGSHCSSNACVCTAPLIECSGRCADILTESANCGGCDKPCGKGQSCTDGKCQCDEGMDLCSGSCFLLQTDESHCGNCDTTCSASQTCTAGECTCGSDLTACGQSCVDAQNDATNCGECGKTCTGTQMCQGGVCKTSVVKVQTQAQADGTNVLRLFISICNASSASLNLNGYSMKYWYTTGGASFQQVVNVTYSPASPAPTATAVMLDFADFRVKADAILTVKFGATTLAAGACTGGIQIELHPDGWSGDYGTQSTDYSYLSGTTLKDNQNVTAYNAQGLLIWGLEPEPDPQ